MSHQAMRWLPISEAAKIARRHRETVREAIHAGRLPSKRDVDGTWYVSEPAVRRLWLQTSDSSRVPLGWNATWGDAAPRNMQEERELVEADPHWVTIEQAANFLEVDTLSVKRYLSGPRHRRSGLVGVRSRFGRGRHKPWLAVRRDTLERWQRRRRPWGSYKKRPKNHNGHEGCEAMVSVNGTHCPRCEILSDGGQLCGHCLAEKAGIPYYALRQALGV